MRDFTTQNKCFSNYTQYNEKGFKMYNSIHTHTSTKRKKLLVFLFFILLLLLLLLL